MVNWWFPSIVW